MSFVLKKYIYTISAQAFVNNLISVIQLQLCDYSNKGDHLLIMLNYYFSRDGELSDTDTFEAETLLKLKDCTNYKLK